MPINCCLGLQTTQITVANTTNRSISGQKAAYTIMRRIYLFLRCPKFEREPDANRTAKIRTRTENRELWLSSAFAFVRFCPNRTRTGH